MKSLTILFALLFMIALGLYLHERHQRLAITETASSAQATADQCEERLARQRFELEEARQSRQAVEGMQALRDLQETLRQQRLREQHQTLREVSISLELDEETTQSVAGLLRRFDAGKRHLVTQTRAEGRFLSDQHLALIEELRQEVLTVLDEIFSVEQYEQFFRQGFAERLDLVGTSQPEP